MSTARRIEPSHEHLVDELAVLPESERRAIVQAADEKARAGAVSSWETIKRLTGLLHKGGNAVEDCRRAWER